MSSMPTSGEIQPILTICFPLLNLSCKNDYDEAQNLIHVGLFETIQNIASHRSFGSTVFRSWLGPRSLIVWNNADLGMKKVAAWASSQKPRWWQFWHRPKTFDHEAALAKVENPELRKIIEQMYRKEP